MGNGTFLFAGKKKLINAMLHVALISSALSDEFNPTYLFGRQSLYHTFILRRQYNLLKNHIIYSKIKIYMKAKEETLTKETERRSDHESCTITAGIAADRRP